MLNPGAFQEHTVLVSASTASEASRVISTSPAFMLAYGVGNQNAAFRFLQFFNSTSVPADTTVPYYTPASIPNVGRSVSSLTSTPLLFSTGIAVCISTTQATKTIAGADALFAVWYKKIDT